jgi:hypothetical protein
MASEPTASTSDAFVLEVSSTRLRVLAFVNDYAIIQNPNGADRVESRKINAFLLEGRSEIRIDVAPTEEIGERRVDVSLYVVRHGDEASQREILRYRYQALPSPLGEEKAVTVLRHQLDVRRGLGPWAWQAARPYDPSRDVPAIGLLLRRMLDALQRKDAAAVLDLMRLKLDEECLATGVDPDATRRQWQGKLDDMMHREIYLAEAAPRLHILPWSGGRLCDVRADDAEPCVYIVAPPHDLALDTTVSCIDGEWTFIR